MLRRPTSHHRAGARFLRYGLSQLIASTPSVQLVEGLLNGSLSNCLTKKSGKNKSARKWQPDIALFGYTAQSLLRWRLARALVPRSSWIIGIINESLPLWSWFVRYIATLCCAEWPVCFIYLGCGDLRKCFLWAVCGNVCISMTRTHSGWGLASFRFFFA